MRSISRAVIAIALACQWVAVGSGRLLAPIPNVRSAGIEHAPGAIAGLYRGENAGKRLVKIR